MRGTGKDAKFEYFRKLVVRHLDGLEKKEEKERTALKKSLAAIEKSGYPVGTIRTWKGNRFIKIAPGKWKRKYDGDSRGAKLAVAALKRKAETCKNSGELLQLVLENKSRFSDANGRPLPFVQELSRYVSSLNDSLDRKKAPAKKKPENKKKSKEPEQEKVSEPEKEPQKTVPEKKYTVADLKYDAKYDKPKAVDFAETDRKLKLAGCRVHESSNDRVKLYVKEIDGGVAVKNILMTKKDYNDLWDSAKKARAEWVNGRIAGATTEENREFWKGDLNYDDPALNLTELGLPDYENYKLTQALRKGKIKVVESFDLPEEAGKSKTDFTLDDIAHLGSRKQAAVKHPETLEECTDIVKMIAKEYGTSEKGRSELADFVGLNIGGASELYDRLHDYYGFSAGDLDDDFDGCYEKILESALKEDDGGKARREERIAAIEKIVDEKMLKYKNSSSLDRAAERMLKRYGEKKLQEYADLNLKSDGEFLSSLKDAAVRLDAEKGSENIDLPVGTAVWNHFLKVKAKEYAQKRLETLHKNKTDYANDIPVDRKDREEAINIIGSDVKRILEGRDTYGNAKQTMTDKIRRRIRNQPGVARAMLQYIRDEQERTGKTIYTDKHSIWEILPKLNENARQAAASGENETKTGVTGSLYLGKDGTTVVENKDWGRYQISFPGKPDGDTVSMLKHNGFRWSPSTKTWVCFNTSNGERSMKKVAGELGLEKNEDVKKSLFGDMESPMPYSDYFGYPEYGDSDISDTVADVLHEIA